MEGSAIAGMTIPDALTPQQYYDGVRADDASARPVKRLMLAVLEDAMRCYQTYANSHNGNQRRLFVDAEAWLMDRRADGPFAFETVCETLGIEPSSTRGAAPMARAAVGWDETVSAGASIASDAHRPDKFAVETPAAKGLSGGPRRQRRRGAITLNGSGIANDSNASSDRNSSVTHPYGRQSS